MVGLFVGGTSVNADVLGPYLVSETITTPEGYASVVPYMSSPYPVTGTITIQDENGNIYKLSVLAPGQSPYRYFLSYGTYRILSVTAPNGAKLQSNWGTLTVGTSFTVTSVGGYIGVYWKNWFWWSDLSYFNPKQLSLPSISLVARNIG